MIPDLRQGDEAESPERLEDRAIDSKITAELPHLRRHAISLLYNHADAEDLVQDCVETALAKKTSLEDPTKLRSWLFSILNNLFLMRIRSEKRRGSSLPIGQFSDSLAASVPPQDRALAVDLARAMGQLSAEHRQVLLLINVEEYSYQEVAEILKVPMGTVMSRVARARQQLRALLEGGHIRVVR